MLRRSSDSVREVPHSPSRAICLGPATSLHRSGRRAAGEAESKVAGGCFRANLGLRAVATHPVAARRPRLSFLPPNPRGGRGRSNSAAQSARHEKPANGRAPFPC
jgi:hypothetical protein